MPSRHNHRACIKQALANAEQQCRRKGTRLTTNRREVLRHLLEGHQAMGAYEIVKRMDWKDRCPAPAQVYRALDFLEAMGLAHRVASRNAYAACYKGPQQHGAVLLVCEECGAVEEVTGTHMDQAMRDVALQSGFSVREPILEAVGHCSACATT